MTLGSLVHMLVYIHTTNYYLPVEMRTLKESVGMLSVTVVEACDLLAKDPNGRSDPFCVLKFGDHQEQNTPVIHSTLNPKWNYKVGLSLSRYFAELVYTLFCLCFIHQMQFSVHDLNTEVLELTVFDKDLFSPNGWLISHHTNTHTCTHTHMHTQTF